MSFKWGALIRRSGTALWRHEMPVCKDKNIQLAQLILGTTNKIYTKLINVKGVWSHLFTQWCLTCEWHRFQHMDSPTAGGVGHGPRDQFCPITLLQMADCFFFTFVPRPFDFLRFLPFLEWFTIIFFGKVWVDSCSKPQFLKQSKVCLFSIDIVLCNSWCA